MQFGWGNLLLCFWLEIARADHTARRFALPRSSLPHISHQKTTTVISFLRGGSSNGDDHFNSPFYELNPNYVAPPGGSSSSSTTTTTTTSITRTRNWPPQDEHSVWIETQMYNNSNNYNDGGVSLGGGWVNSNPRRQSLGRFVPTSSSQKILSSATLMLEDMKYYIQRLHQISPTLSYTLLSCIFVHILWYIPMMRPVLENYFVCKDRNLQPMYRSISVLLSSISHQSILHLIVNLYGFLSFGPTIQRVLVTSSYPRWPIWPLITGSAITGSLFFLVLSRLGGVMSAAATAWGCLGLSDVTLSLATMYARLFPHQQLGIVLFGIIPINMAANKLLRLMVAWSVLGSILSLSGHGAGSMSDVAHLAHLGGIVYGYLYYEVWIRRKQLQLFKR